MRRILLGTVVPVMLASISIGPAVAKTAKACNAAYAALTPEAKAKQKRADFLTACRAEPEVPGAAAATPSTVPPRTDAGLPKPSAAELAEQRKLKHDMNICIGC